MLNRELKFQSHILDAYEDHGGYGRKWASDLQVGAFDLVVSLPVWGIHGIEVKHRPTWSEGFYKNPMTPKQIENATSYWKAGGNALGCVITGEKAINSTMWLFWPFSDEIELNSLLSTRWREGSAKYDIKMLLEAWRANYGWQ